MKKRTIHVFTVFFVASALLMPLVFAATDAPAEFYVIAGSRGVGTEIKSLPYTISSSGFYYITKNLSCGPESHGITIVGHNVTLDLMGFNLAGSGQGIYHGIYMNQKTNVEIRNGTVRNFPQDGIHEESVGTGHRIINIRTRNNGRRGIYFASEGRNHIVKNCTAVGNASNGIDAAGSGSTVTGNTCYNNALSGIYAGNGSTVTGNNCSYNGDDGISAGSGSTVIGNTCLYNTNYGIDLGGYNLVDQNTAYGNGTSMSNPTGCVFGTNVGAPSP